MPVDASKVKLNAEQVAYLQKIVAFFTALGWSIFAAVGIAANIFAECSFRPRLTGDGGRAYGLCQWHPDRQAIFRKVYGMTMAQAPEDKQLQFIDYELRNNEKRAGNLLKGVLSASQGGALFSRHYERPALKEAEAKARGALAQKFYEDYFAPKETSPTV